MKLFIVMTVDIGLESNFVPHCLGAFKTNEDAVQCVKDDMADVLAASAEMEPEVDEIKYVIQTADGQYGAVWNIEEVEAF